MIGLKRNRGWSSVNVHDLNHMSSEVFCVYAVGDRLDMRAPKCSGWGWPQLHHAAVPSASQQGRPVALSSGHGSVHCCGPGPHGSPQEADQGCASHSALYHQGEPHRQDYTLNSLQPDKSGHLRRSPSLWECILCITASWTLAQSLDITAHESCVSFQHFDSPLSGPKWWEVRIRRQICCMLRLMQHTLSILMWLAGTEKGGQKAFAIQVDPDSPTALSQIFLWEALQMTWLLAPKVLQVF